MLKHRNIRFFICAFLCFTLAQLSSLAHAKSEIKIGYGIIDGYINKDQTGPGYEIFQAVTKRLEQRGYQVDITTSPSKRSIAKYLAGELDALFPIVMYRGPSANNYKKWKLPQIPLYSSPLYNGGQFVIYNKSSRPKRNTIKSLKNDHIGVIAGAFIPGELKAPTLYTVSEIATPQQAFKMVAVGRIDSFVVHENWADSSFLKELDGHLHYGKKFGDIYGGFITQQTDDGAVLLGDINHIIATMIVDGTYRQIMNRYPNNEFLIRYGK